MELHDHKRQDKTDFPPARHRCTVSQRRSQVVWPELQAVSTTGDTDCQGIPSMLDSAEKFHQPYVKFARSAGVVATAVGMLVLVVVVEFRCAQVAGAHAAQHES